jgi:hypothetical protein
MKVKQILGGGCLALFLSAIAGTALADNARLPYRQLYNVQKAEEELNRAHTNLLVVLTLQSVLPDVKPSDLSVYIDSKGGQIPIPIGSVGDFTVPLRDDLLAENPWIITNQRKGTMKLNWAVAMLPGPIPKSVHYASLMQPVQDSEGVQDQMRRFFPGSPKLVITGLRLTFAASQTKPVLIIHARDGDRKLEANQQGKIILPLTTDLLEENPELSFSDAPATVEIVSHESGQE